LENILNSVIRITDEHNYGDRKVFLHFLQAPNQEATFALQMLERFGLIAGRDDGEDTTGRAKAQLLSVAETVARAFDLSAEAFRVMRERAMLVDLPDPNIINAENDAKRAAKRERETA
jgi:hypothetical protein